MNYSTIILLYTVPVQGGWSEWTPTVQCTSPCIDGIEQFTRSCTRPVPIFGGEECIGNATKTISCGSPICGMSAYLCPLIILHF